MIKKFKGPLRKIPIQKYAGQRDSTKYTSVCVRVKRNQPRVSRRRALATELDKNLIVNFNFIGWDYILLNV